MKEKYIKNDDNGRLIEGKRMTKIRKKDENQENNDHVKQDKENIKSSKLRIIGK